MRAARLGRESRELSVDLRFYLSPDAEQQNHTSIEKPLFNRPDVHEKLALGLATPFMGLGLEITLKQDVLWSIPVL